MKVNPESEAIETLAKTILVAARTAPKAKGLDDIITAIVEEADIKTLTNTMEELGEKKGFPFFKRDAHNVRDSEAVLIIGIKEPGIAGLNCGACGFSTCAQMLKQQKIESDYIGPNCSLKYVDLGIALGAAVAKAKDLCIDNRIMYTVGAAARVSGLIDANVAFGIPLSVKGKNILFDRK